MLAVKLAHSLSSLESIPTMALKSDDIDDPCGSGAGTAGRNAYANNGEAFSDGIKNDEGDREIKGKS